MTRGDLYRVRRPGGGDPRRSRVFVAVSRQTLIDSRLSTVVCRGGKNLSASRRWTLERAKRILQERRRSEDG